MTVYVKTLYVVENTEVARAFNKERGYDNELFVPEFAIPYGTIPKGHRFELAIIKYKGTRNSKYEQELAELQRNDIQRSFTE